MSVRPVCVAPLVGVAVIAVGGFAWALSSFAEEPKSVTPVPSIESEFPNGFALDVCPTEDSSDCYWPGASDGSGRSFIDLGGVAYYLPAEVR